MARARTGQRTRAPGGPEADAALGNGPRLPRVYIPRHRLWEQLDRATEGALTLLVAPGGAGKTLGVGGWVTVSSVPQAKTATWIQGDDPTAAEQLERLVSAGVSSRAAGTNASPPLVIVDDAHALPAPTVRMLDHGLSRAPETMRVLLLSRWDLAITRLVPELLGHFTILRGEILRLNDSESAELITEHARTDHPDVIRIVCERAQGWCAALVLAARTVGAARDPVAAAEQLAIGGAPVADRVASEVFATLGQRQRHLLLCVAGEGVVSVSTAAHLAHDPGAGDVLDELETTGFLVTRVPTPPRHEPQSIGDVSYRIHPLLAEVIRRQLAVGGADVAHAQATVVRAVGLDIARGRLADAFRRLVTVDAEHDVADLLARHGVGLVLGRLSQVDLAGFAQTHPQVVDARPDTWFALALERWILADVEEAQVWSERIMEHVAGEPESAEPAIDAVRVACVRLWRALLGLEPVYAAIGSAKRVSVAHREHTSTPAHVDSAMPILLNDLGAAQNWLGDLAEAEANLTLAVGLSRSRGLDTFAINSLTHLALTEFMAGREHACVELAREALTLAGTHTGARLRFTPYRASLGLLLGQLVDLPAPADPAALAERGVSVHSADLSVQFWSRMRDARLELMAGSAAAAEQVLETPTAYAELVEANLPDHLRAAMLVERAFLAALSSDRGSLRMLAGNLAALHARGEAALVEGLLADLDGDRRRAASSFETAAADAVYSQPPTRALALACHAQLLDALGEPEAALELLAVAATETEVRRNAVPFLGWTRQGTPMRVLLPRLGETSSSRWVREINETLAEVPEVMSSYRASTPNPREREAASDSVVRPLLSPREREVLGELARGATYADIAASLFVSENTVKTHVSSLYGKLAVSRRSEALAVARSLHLL